MASGALMQCEHRAMTYKTLFLTICALLTLSSCHSEPSSKTLAVAERQFIDIETMKPIEGGWVHFIWYGKPKPNGMSSCRSAVLGRSGPDGWFRDTAQDPSWRLDEMTVFFVPGYQRVMLDRIESDPDHLMILVPETDQYYGKMPGFEQRLRDQGFVYHPDKAKDKYSYNWTKRIVRKGFPRGDFPQRYFIRYHGFPGEVGQNFSFLGRICDDPGSRNVGLAQERIEYTDKLRSISSTRFFCDPIWKGSEISSDEKQVFITRASWILSDRKEAWEHVSDQFGQWNFNHLEALPKFDEHKKNGFCAWILPKVEMTEAELLRTGPPLPTVEIVPISPGIHP